MISLQEVRPGLIRIHWDFFGLMNEVGSYKEMVCLYKYQLGLTYTITYQLERTVDISDYLYTVTLEESLCSCACCNDASHSDRSAIELFKPLQPNESSIPRAKVPEAEVLRPVYMWLKSAYAECRDMPLEKISPIKWKVSSKISKTRDLLTLYIDFGTNTLSQRNISNGLAEMLKNQNLCDVHFHFNDGQTIGAHAVILSAGSPVFSAMFQLNMLESQTRQVTITDCAAEVFKQLLIHLYSGNAPRLAEENMTQLIYVAADKYGVSTLKSDCVNVLLKRVRVDNAIKLLIWSHFNTIPKLFVTAMKFLVENCREICCQPEWIDFTRNYPDLCVIATQRMIALVPSPTFSSLDN